MRNNKLVICLPQRSCICFTCGIQETAGMGPCWHDSHTANDASYALASPCLSCAFSCCHVSIAETHTHTEDESRPRPGRRRRCYVSLRMPVIEILRRHTFARPHAVKRSHSLARSRCIHAWLSHPQNPGLLLVESRDSQTGPEAELFHKPQAVGYHWNCVVLFRARPASEKSHV